MMSIPSTSSPSSSKTKPPFFAEEDRLSLFEALEKASDSLPLFYQKHVSRPFIEKIKGLGLDKLLFQANSELDKEQRSRKKATKNTILAIVSHRDYEKDAAHALQENFRSFLANFSKEKKRVLPPLINWEDRKKPYLLPICDTSSLELPPIISLPSVYASRKLSAWPVLMHVLGGQIILGTTPDLLEELQGKIAEPLRELFENGYDEWAVSYWKNCMGSVISDILGILNLGPVSSIALIELLREQSRSGRLGKTGNFDSKFPAAILRVYIAAAVVKKLSFKLNTIWSEAIEREGEKEFGKRVHIKSGKDLKTTMSKKLAVKMTQTVTEAVIDSKLKSLRNRSLHQIQDWTDKDEAITEEVRLILRNDDALPTDYYSRGIRANHVLAAATLEVLKTDPNDQKIFTGMKKLLVKMHQDHALASSKYPIKIAKHEYTFRGQPRKIVFVEQEKPEDTTAIIYKKEGDGWIELNKLKGSKIIIEPLLSEQVRALQDRRILSNDKLSELSAHMQRNILSHLEPEGPWEVAITVEMGDSDSEKVVSLNLSNPN